MHWSLQLLQLFLGNPASCAFNNYYLFSIFGHPSVSALAFSETTCGTPSPIRTSAFPLAPPSLRLKASPSLVHQAWGKLPRYHKKLLI